ncbi:uncharacterized protein LOC120258548 isoform X2 [Dioscorea cayenensis subsp. rotundata]|uniref:Uncharacterized protein LOC120258548 isoform X2 n=1 Tax=Dioscorea cayennensis subsp. rotundata TaxID=55577 RepID=A0AB40B3T0_DIOCR|nr:uncharacterized protein LOC120258548 isoform X2 [Dioscorea cayenensis subsp. rotundata]
MEAAGKGFADLDPVFGEAKAEWSHSSASPASPLHQFLFHARALDPSCLEIAATDFHSHTFDLKLTVLELEDLRDDVGIGGSWFEFLDYLIASLSSEDVKLVLDSPAHKSKGLPRISLSLNRSINSSANDVMASLSLVLFGAFKQKQNDVIKGKEHSRQLAISLTSEKERCESLQRQLDSCSFSKMRKAPKLKGSDDNTPPVADTINNLDASLVSKTQQALDVPSGRDAQPVKAVHRAAPVNRRTKVRGALLQDSKDDDGT